MSSMDFSKYEEEKIETAHGKKIKLCPKENSRNY